MIWYFTPYTTTKNLGAAYNQYMSLIPGNDAACLMDGDTMFLTPDFGCVIENYQTLYPDAVLTCRTNRIHHLSKQLDDAMDEDCNVRHQIIKAENRKRLTSVTEIKPGEGMSGFLMVVPKKIWNEIQFVENGGCLGVDSQFRIDLHNAGKKIFIMDGLYIFHQYRLTHNSKKHLL